MGDTPDEEIGLFKRVADKICLFFIAIITFFRGTFKESVRQAFVVMKNEIKKYFSGKRMFVFLVLMGIVVFVIVFAPYMFGSKAKPVYFLMMSALVVLMASTLFASISIVAEYEERTALIVFTRPIRKTSIFVGKALASLVLTIAFMALYYLIAIVASIVIDGSVSADTFTSFGLTCAYAFGTTGIAMFVSSVMKKGSTATIITFVILAVIITAISLVLNAAKVESFWMIDQAAASIETCSEAYRNLMNDMLSKLASKLANPMTFIDAEYYIPAHFNEMDYNQLVLALITPVDPAHHTAWNLMGAAEEIGELSVSAPDYIRDVFVMIVWGAVSMVGAFIAFLRREF